MGVIKASPPTTDFTSDFLIHFEESRRRRRIPDGASGAAATPQPICGLPRPARPRRWATASRASSTVTLRPLHHTAPHKDIALRLTPLLKMHLITPPAEAIVAATAAVAVLTLLLAAVKYVNLATARASMRAMEVELRKVMDATRPGLIAQFVGESVVVAPLFGSRRGLALCELALPLFSAAIGVTLKLDYLGDPWLAGMMAFVVLKVGVG